VSAAVDATTELVFCLYPLGATDTILHTYHPTPTFQYFLGCTYPALVYLYHTIISFIRKVRTKKACSADQYTDCDKSRSTIFSYRGLFNMASGSFKFKKSSIKMALMFFCLSVMIAPTGAFLRHLCFNPLGLARIDPIVTPDKPSQHVHHLHGSSSKSILSKSSKAF
jgi:hypothetical protein